MSSQTKEQKQAPSVDSIVGYDPITGTAELTESDEQRKTLPTTVWTPPSHNYSSYGSWMLRRFVPRATFSHPKSIYAVEDALRFYLTNKPQAKVLDIYAGSGSTAHAVMLLNATDGGARESTSVTINELSPHRLRHLALAGLDGDENDPTGVFYAVLVPRLKAALTGLTPSGDPVKGKYCFPDRTACSEGLPGQLAVMTRQVVRQAQAAQKEPRRPAAQLVCGALRSPGTTRTLDPFEVAKVSMWPYEQMADRPKKELTQLVNQLEYSVYVDAIRNSKYSAILNEKIPPISEEVELPPNCSFDLVPEGMREDREHPDVRIARRAENLSRLSAVAHERGEVSPGLRRVIVIQAVRLADLAAARLSYVEGRRGPSPDAINVPELVGNVIKELGES